MKNKEIYNGMVDSETMSQTKAVQNAESANCAEVTEKTSNDDAPYSHLNLDEMLKEDNEPNQFLKHLIYDSIYIHDVEFEPKELVYYYCETIKMVLFSTTPFESVRSIIKFLSHLGAKKMCYILDKITSYIDPDKLELSEWDSGCQQDIYWLLSAESHRYQKKGKPIIEIREQLAELIREEFKKLPDIIKNLDDKDRISFLCKAMPYVMPHVESEVALDNHGDFSLKF